MAVDISKVTSLCDKIDTGIGSIADEGVKGVMTDIAAALRLINNNHEGIVKSQLNKVAAAVATANATQSVPGMISLGNVSKKNRSDNQVPDGNTDSDSSSGFITAGPSSANFYLERQREEISPEMRKFRDAVATAENSTLVFNLDMGRVPIMNTETMSTRATLALAAMAAANEKRPGSIPTEDTVSTIDDILSLAKNIEFFGKKTKTYSNSNDTKSGSFCTVPVKYEFSDREVKFEAEQFLRTKCGAHCSTPYPIILRECIRQVTEKVKADYPDNQVKVQVDSKNFCLKVARRFVKEGTDKKTVKWESYERTIPLPSEALDVDARRVPEDFRIRYLPPDREKGLRGSPQKRRSVDRPGNETMEISSPGGASASASANSNSSY
jgi:hypothetical protein